MTWLDVLPFLLIIVYAALGYFTGVLRRGIGLVALYVAFLAATGMGLQAGSLLNQASTLDTPDARITGFFGILVIVLVLIDGAAQLAHAQIRIEAIYWNRATGVIVGLITAVMLSALVVYLVEAAGNPSGGGDLSGIQAQLHDTVKDSRLVVPLINNVDKPIIAIFTPVLPNDPNQYFSRGPVT
jgi:uncharacterized membrane protein required for colicin V production